MPRPRIETPRVVGPAWSASKGKYRVTTLDPGADEGRGRRADRYFVDEQEAKDWAGEVARGFARLEDRTVADAVDAYLAHLEARGAADRYRVELGGRLRGLLGPALGHQLTRLKPDRAAELYDAFREGRAVDTHRGALGNARGLLAWCVRQGYVQANPFGGVEGVGRRRRGKAQLTGDEAKAWYEVALDWARRGDEGALGCLMLFLMGLRSSDVTRRVVRDLDLGGTVLRVERGKTARSNRPRRVPEVLQPMLVRVASGRPSMAPLLPVRDGNVPTARGGHHTKSWLQAALRRLCVAASVPVVCPHSLKGLAGSLLAETGELSDRIADHLSHESSKTTERHYVREGALEDARRERGLAVLQGGKR